MKPKPEKKSAPKRKPTTEDKQRTAKLAELNERLAHWTGRLAILDARLGAGVGAKIERTRNHKKIEALRVEIDKLTKEAGHE